MLVSDRLGGFLLHGAARLHRLSTGCNAVPPRQYVDRTNHIGMALMPAPDAAECRLRLPVSGAHGSNAGTQFAGITWPRISPAGCSFVWTLKYHLPPIRSVTCASVSSFGPDRSRQLLLRDRHLHARVLADRRRPVEVRGGGRPREVFVSDLPLQHVRGRVVGGLDVARALVAVGGTSLDGWRLADRRTVSAAALPAASTPASNATWSKRSLSMDSPCTTLYAARAGRQIGW